MKSAAANSALSVTERIRGLAWDEAETQLAANGFARLGEVLRQDECESLRTLYAEGRHFRSRIDMARYRFGKGEYQYFSYPLPSLVEGLRKALYERLAGAATAWMTALGRPEKFPIDHAEFVKQCAKRGQTRPTPLLLRYRTGDHNCLHQDVYGDVVFPFQVIFCLSQPEQEFTGGELLLVEQRPRAQSIGHAVRLGQGEGVVIITRWRPVRGSRGYYRANVRHGVSEVLSGERYTLGIIFHDGK